MVGYNGFGGVGYREQRILMRVLHVFDHSLPLHSGYTFRSRSILRAQHQRGWQTIHVTSGKHQADMAEEEADGLHFFRTERSAFWSTVPVLNQWHIVRQLKKRLRTVIAKTSPDVIHAHSPCLNGLAAAQVAKEYQLPFVYEVRAFWEDAAVDHGTTQQDSLRYRLTRALETSVFRQADAITCICQGLKQDIIARGIPEQKITVIPNAVDIESFNVIDEKNNALLQQYQLQGCTVLGFLGSFYAYEGLDVLLHAMAKLKSQQPSLRLLLVGGGPQEQNLRELAQQLNIEQQVIFVGRVPHARVSEYYSLVDVLVYPRHKMRLTDLVTPLKPLEAMAQKKLVLASDVGGHRELIDDGRTGYLFAADDVQALSDGIVRVLNERDRWPALLDAGREYVLRERNWQNSVANYQDVYPVNGRAHG